MQWEFVVALIVAIPVILIPVALVWYFNIGGIHAAIKKARDRRVAAEEGTRAVAAAEQHIAEATAKEQRAEKELVETKR